MRGIIILIGLWSVILVRAKIAAAAELHFNQRIYSTPSANVQIGQPSAITSIQIPQFTGPFSDETVKDVITLGVDQYYPQYFGNPAETRVKLNVESWDVSNNILPAFSIYLQTNYHPFDSVPYRDRQLYPFNNAYKYKITIDSIYVNGSSQNTLPKNLYIDADIFVTRWYNFTGNAPALAATDLDVDCDGLRDNLLVTWTGMADAEEYDLEWTFANDYKDTSDYLSFDSINYNFRNNASRITVSSSTTVYEIPLLFDHGYFVCRIRSLGLSPTTPHRLLYGYWSVQDSGDIINIPTACIYHVTVPHEKNKNWQAAITFAEEGKKKELVKYFDGTLRNRQYVTRLSTDSNTLVGQHLYDHEGRNAINVMSSPTGDQCNQQSGLQSIIKYYPRFNRNTSDEPYDPDEFDKDSVSPCTVLAAPMNTSSGASRYYSAANPDKKDQQAFIPDAFGFPFSQTEYTPDNTGRIRRKGNVGQTFQLGSGHEIFYYYGQPQQLEIDRLFGSEAGDASHYQKNMIRDPNGQLSISYLDQEGHIVATALGGDTVTGMFAIPSAKKTIIQLTSDLFNKDNKDNSILNTLVDNSIVFNSQLLVSQPGNYSFSYNLTVDTLEDPCLMDHICFNCVYDLEIKVTDECGVNHALIAGSPIKETLGHFISDDQGNIVLSFGCSTPSGLDIVKSFTTSLPPGNYTISKVLAVNESAKKQFIDSCLNSAYYKCIPTLKDFIDKAIKNIDTSDCYIACEQCLVALGSRDSFVALGYGSALYYDFLADQCKATCNTPSYCQTNYQLMLADVSPGGQYGQYLNSAGEVSVSMYPLSVFNEENKLSAPNADWRHPVISLFGSEYPSYVEEDGELSTVILSGEPGNFMPELLDTSFYFLSTSGEYCFTYPENLNHLEDFISRWKSSWAKSLVKYHPEYCYYLNCLDYCSKIDPVHDLLTSDDFDALLQSTFTFDDAIKNGFIKATYSSFANPIDRIKPWWNSSNPVSDPFMVHSSEFDGYGEQLKAQMTAYTNISGTIYDMVSFAAFEARCEGLPAHLIPNNHCTPFGDPLEPISDSIRNKEWNILKHLYLSAKKLLQWKRANDFAINACAGYNDCIGYVNWSPFGTVMMNGSCSNNLFSECPFYDPNQPCNIETYKLYQGKIKRFSNPQTSPLHPEDPTSVSYQHYLVTGRCPNAKNFENVLSELSSMDSLTQSNVNLNTKSSFNGLFLSINKYISQQPLTDFNFSWNATISGDNLSFTINNGISTVFFGQLNKSGSGIASWNDVKVIREMKVNSNDGISSYFEALSGQTSQDGSSNPYTYSTITGNINLDLKNCLFQQGSPANEFAVDLTMLMSALAADQRLLQNNVSLNDPNFADFITPSILNLLSAGNANNLFWNYESAFNRFTITEGATVLSITISGTEPASFNLSELSNALYFSNTTSNYFNFFKMEAYNQSDLLLATIEASVILSTPEENTPVSMGKTGLPESVLCADPIYKTTEAFFDVIKDVLVNKDLTSSINLFANPFMTSSLAQMFLPDQLCASTYVKSVHESVLNDTLKFTRICPIILAHHGNITDGILMDNVTEVKAVLLTDPPDDFGNFHHFAIVATIQSGLSFYTDTIWGTTCIPLLLCNCDEESSAPGPLIIPDTLFKSAFCDSLYQEYLSAVNKYNNYVRAHKELKFPLVSSILDKKLFSPYGYCYCVNAFQSFLQSIIFGATANTPQLAQQLLTFFENCKQELQPSCVNDYFDETRVGESFPIRPDQCIMQLIATSITTAENNYHHSIDSLRNNLSTVYVKHCLGALEGFDATYDFHEYHFTLYYYDQAGNLVKTVPPEGVEPLEVTSSYDPLEQQIIFDRTNHTHTVFTSHRLSSRYEYNSLNKLVKQSFPDHDKMNIFQSEIPAGINPEVQVTAIQFVSENFGYLSGYILLTGGKKRGFFYTTSDAGKTWQFSPTVVASNLKKIFWVNANVAYAVGSNGTLIKTSDSGQSWDLLNTYINNRSIYNFNDLCFIDSLNAFIGGQNGKLLKTTDGGNTFQNVNAALNLTDEVTAFARDGNFLYAAIIVHYPGITPSTGSRIIYLNLNAGGNWNSATIYPLNPLTIHNCGNGRAYAPGINGTILKRVKVGSAFYWLSIQSQLKKDFRDIDFIDDFTGIALAEDNFHHGKVYTTTDGGVSWTLLQEADGYYNSMFVYDEIAAIHKVVFAGEHGAVLKVSFLVGGNFGTTKLKTVFTASSLKSVWAAEHGNTLYILTGDSLGKIFFNNNANYLSSSWVTLNFNLGDQCKLICAKDYYTGGSYNISGIFLGFLGGVKGFNYRYNNGNPILTTALLTGASSSNIDASLEFSSGKIIVSDNSPVRLSYLNTFPSVAPTSITTFSISGSNVSYPFYQIDVRHDTVFASSFGNNTGDLLKGVISGNHIQLVNESNLCRSQPIMDLPISEGSNVFACGVNGMFLTRTSATGVHKFSTATSAVTEKFNSGKMVSGNSGYLVSDSGNIYSASYDAGTYNVNLQLVGQSWNVPLNDIAISGNEAFVAGDTGLLLRSTSIGVMPFKQLFVNSTASLNGISFRPGNYDVANVYVVGDNSTIFFAVNGTALQLNSIYLPSIQSLDFTDAQNGFLLADKFNIRQTHDGGSTWKIVTPLSSIGAAYPNLLTIKSTTPGKAYIGGKAMKYYEVDSTSAAFLLLNISGVPLSADIVSFGVSQINHSLKYMLVRNGNASNSPGYFLQKNNSWIIKKQFSNKNPASIWVFRNDNAIIVGSQSLMYFYNGTQTISIYPQSTLPSGINLKTVKFYDDINGYVAGEKGFLIKTKGWSFDMLPFSINYTGGSWERKPVKDNLLNQVDSTKVIINTLAPSDRFHLITGGSYTGSAAVPGYVRLLHDESLIYSIRFWYDRAGRLILSQNTKQFSVTKKQFSYTRYDALGRIVETGVKSENESNDPAFNTIFGDYVNSYFNPEIIDNNKFNSWINAVSGKRKEVIRTYFDGQIESVPFPSNFNQENLRQRIASVTYNDTFHTDQSVYNSASHYSYDIHGNVKTLLQDNPWTGLNSELQTIRLYV